MTEQDPHDITDEPTPPAPQDDAGETDIGDTPPVELGAEPPEPPESSETSEAPEPVELEDAFEAADAGIPIEDDAEELGEQAVIVENGTESVQDDQAAQEPVPAPSPRPSAAESDDTSDVASIPDEPVEDHKSPTSQRRSGDWQTEMSAHRIAVELKRVETRIRDLLSERDSRRKRKLAGTFRWHELEEDIIAWRAERRFDDDTLEELHRLTCRRHHLFNQLRFAASTRPTWNS